MRRRGRDGANLTVSLTWFSSSLFTRSVLLMMVRSARAICLGIKKYIFLNVFLELDQIYCFKGLKHTPLLLGVHELKRGAVFSLEVKRQTESKNAKGHTSLFSFSVSVFVQQQHICWKTQIETLMDKW